MADDNALSDATQPLSFAEFLEKMKDPAAADLVRTIKQCVVHDVQDVQDGGPAPPSLLVLLFDRQPSSTRRACPRLQPDQRLMYVHDRRFIKTFDDRPPDPAGDSALVQVIHCTQFCTLQCKRACSSADQASLAVVCAGLSTEV